MERAVLFSLIVLACVAGEARADCLLYAPQVVTLSGKLEERPPLSRADDRVTSSARPRRAGLVLVLAEPICVADEAAPNKREEAVTEIGLVFGDKALRAPAGGALQVTGSLSRSLGANGSPRVVMLVRRIHPAAAESP